MHQLSSPSLPDLDMDLHSLEDEALQGLVDSSADKRRTSDPMGLDALPFSQNELNDKDSEAR